MATTRIVELDMAKLEGNKYNPRKTMDKKGLASLEKSLERDGQLQTILVRPIDGGKYEVVAGMRRYLSLKSLGVKKAMCTVQEMDDQTAMQRAFKENVERESLSPVDEAMWFFEMLGLKGEQLYTEKAEDSALTLPTAKNLRVRDLADALGAISPTLIEDRLPLLALPENMQKQVGQEDGILVEKAKALARLRNETRVYSVLVLPQRVKDDMAHRHEDIGMPFTTSTDIVKGLIVDCDIDLAKLSLDVSTDFNATERFENRTGEEPVERREPF